MDISIGKAITVTAGYLLVVISLIPLIRNDNWFFRIFEYPRSQKLFINIVLLVSFLVFFEFKTTHDLIFTVLLALNTLYLVYQVWPYTFLSKNQIKRSKANKTVGRFKLLIFNVYQDNRDVKSCLRSIEQNNPDLILLVETDDWWKSELDKKLLKDYVHQLARPLENTYGMVLYSKFELMDPQIKYLVEDDIPSIHTKVRLPSGQIFKLYGIHPQPPVPQENPRSTERDAEILIVAKEAVKSKIPVVVAGDLNDVAWSYTTELFLKVSKLLDPRRGRGFYNTFHAHYWFLRWPLDHVFCSAHFELCNLKRLSSIGSDHFPMLIELCLADTELLENKKQELEADQGDYELAEEKIRDAR